MCCFKFSILKKSVLHITDSAFINIDHVDLGINNCYRMKKLAQYGKLLVRRPTGMEF